MKQYTWDDLRKVQKEETLIQKFLLGVPQEYRKAFALALALLKWEPAQGKQRGYGRCALCVLAATNRQDCLSCPLYVVNGCGRSNGLWAKWLDAPAGSRKEKNVADSLYKTLVELYNAEYRRLEEEI